MKGYVARLTGEDDVSFCPGMDVPAMQYGQESVSRWFAT
jgi:hypothetical protein